MMGNMRGKSELLFLGKEPPFTEEGGLFTAVVKLLDLWGVAGELQTECFDERKGTHGTQEFSVFQYFFFK